MNDENPYPTCAVCGRRLLAGERPSTFMTRDWAEVTVCELCKPRAEAAGWMRPEEADEMRSSGAARERRRPRGQVLGGLLSRLPASQADDDEDRSPRRAAADPVERAAPPAREATDEAAATLAAALGAFNFSDHRRTVAGLSRTLGPPRASGLVVKAQSGGAGVRVTVAWELTWYQWEVTPGERGLEVRESGKGETIGQLRAADRSWNLLVDSDGTLEQRESGVAAGEQEAR